MSNNLPIIRPPRAGGSTHAKNGYEANLFFILWKNCLEIPINKINTKVSKAATTPIKNPLTQ
jgi:hypothetical protein